MSQHLGVLSAAGSVEARPDGRYRRYRLRPEGMAALRQVLDTFWTNEIEASSPAARAWTTNGKEDPMTIEKSVLVPLNAEQTFALLTEPERLRRWQAVTARVEPARRGCVPLDRRAGGQRLGHLRRGGARQAPRLRLRLGGRGWRAASRARRR